ncbi:hypothetical protein FKM82_013497 [Ascaphus truei]
MRCRHALRLFDRNSDSETLHSIFTNLYRKTCIQHSVYFFLETNTVDSILLLSFNQMPINHLSVHRKLVLIVGVNRIPS